MTALPGDPSLLAAAAVWAGPGASRGDVEDRWLALELMAEEDSPGRRRVARVLGASRFLAILSGVELEESSTRAVLTLSVGQGPGVPEEVESIRSDRTDRREGARFLRRAQSLVGHRVVVFKVLEDIDGTRKARVAVHLVDLGEAVVR